MNKQKFGEIINIATVASEKGLNLYPAYVASKHGVLGLTRILGAKFALFNV